jgi:Phospholipase A2
VNLSLFAKRFMVILSLSKDVGAILSAYFDKLRVTIKILLILLLFGASSTCIRVDKRDVAFPIYGKWCGLLYPKLGENPQPIDATDVACEHHDRCYDVAGNFNPVCDHELITELKSVTPKTDREKAARKAILSYFKQAQKVPLGKVF